MRNSISSFQGFHAREWITIALATYIIQQLVEEPANAKLLSNIDWYIMPVVNPDGIFQKEIQYKNYPHYIFNNLRFTMVSQRLRILSCEESSLAKIPVQYRIKVPRC